MQNVTVPGACHKIANKYKKVVRDSNYFQLPEGFFLQVFLSVQALLLSFFGYWSGTVELVLWLFYMYITYRQLFGYGWWSTLWRLFVVMLTQVAVLVIVVVGVIYFFGLDEEAKADGETMMHYTCIVAVTAIFTAVTLFITHLINKRNSRCKQCDQTT